jgi:hypothetical protein
MDEELRGWFEGEGLLRYAVAADESGAVTETWRGPLVALGARDEDFVQAPKPDDTGYGKPLRAMVMEDYNNFMYRWLEAAAHASDLRCANCGRVICDADDLPDPETWDAIFIEKELVAWMAVHFDCKKWLAKKLKGMHPFELDPAPPPRYDLSAAAVPERRPPEEAESAAVDGQRS